VESAHLLSRFEHEPDGSWVCVAPARIETPQGPIDIEPGSRFAFGERHHGLDVAEYLEQLGAQFGS